MKFIPSLVALVLCGASASAQQPPVPARPPVPATPPVAPAPAPTPVPARAPRAVIVGPDFDFGGRMYIDGERLRVDAERMAREALDRSFDAGQRGFDASQRALEAATRANSRMDENAVRAGERAQEAAQRAMERVGRDLEFAGRDMSLNFSTNLAPLARIASDFGTNLASTISNDFAYSINTGYNSSLSYAPIAQTRWQWSQDPDPADSLYSAARDAMNRGEYRRSAELFMQMQSKYPKSQKVSAAAYYEAFMRYRIGTNEELKSALKILTEKNISSSSSSSVNSEISVLTTRVRGALAARGDAEQARIVAAEAQKGGCDREDMQVRAEALSALAQSDQNAATPMLRNVLNKKDACSLDLRRRALSILLRRADTAATSAAIQVAKNNDETLELRVDAVNYLSRLPGDNALATLEDLMRNSTEREVQRAAVRSLSNTENVRARSTVRTIIERNDVSEELRAEALSSFSKDRSSPEDAAYLRGLFPKMQSERLKTSVLSAISRMGGPENDQFLLSVARNAGESSETRSNAISRLARSTTTISVSDLGKLYDAAESRSIRSQVINALSQRKEPEALDKLLDILKTGTDYNIKSQIISSLSRSTDPRAKQALLDWAGRAN
ncbi:MAG: HEAT repeat domain-containing protein [Gemmatimonadaceae bacterium]